MSKKQSFPTKADVLARTPDPAVRDMLRHMEQAGIDTPFDRFDAQKPHCGFGLNGTCCKNCHMGPCRITPKSPKGVCGADAHLIVARNLLRWTAAGVAAHGARGREVMLALKGAAEGTLDLPILGPEKVIATAKSFGIFDEAKPVQELAGEIALILLEDLCRTIPGPYKTLETLAPPERIKVWKELDILPIGAYHEVFEALHRTTTGTDGDWQNVAAQILRCGLAFAWSSVVGSAIAMDCLYGLPKRSRIATNLGAITLDTVNIAVHGHSPVLVAAIVKAARSEELIAEARAAGAETIRLYGICCSGHSALAKFGDITPLANAAGAELTLATGALDLWVADVQDVFPGIMDVAACFHTRVVTTSDSARLPGAEHLAFDHHHSNLDQADRLASQIVRRGIQAYGERQAGKVFVPKARMEAEVGFSVENVVATFGGIDVLLDHLRSGRIRGVVNLVGCNNPKVVYEEAIVKVAEELIAHDILVFTNGCAAFALLKMGFCLPEGLEGAGPGLNAALQPHRLPPVWHMGECLDNARASAFFRTTSAASEEPLTRLPLAFSSPEWSNEKGLGAALGFRLLGLNSYHCIAPPVAGSDRVADFFYRGTGEMLGSVMVVDEDPSRLAQRIVADFDARRRELGWSPAAAPTGRRLLALEAEKAHQHAHAHGHAHTHSHEEGQHHE
ncbi:anaerobic carbon-monoxide dehydrogenase catalytic subunit [Geomesophilobacter sediminis]|uniref:anaerobic carbon-monoxide dehydrogenase n=1 Tax=Geomesophilobacter sediminis TaxID=2798584 RepID=A0A8J7JEC3_9BACT|nr:anaerobic carbon-monoxide dehydrogenase catalytic subunit [Geomesophilobacter sediminis]MBJ6724359.1 anaerobic carbon-monoxide dehydrogenase catalytic subunit [Geomesophilobacter sediminis]